MQINFTKMHGIGNDYVYINCFKENLEKVDISRLSIKMSKRHFSVGSDGVILICPSKVADVKMRMFNADGSEGKMCGNGVRCVAKYVYDYKIKQAEDITVETLSGIKKIKVNVKNGKVNSAVVDMGIAIIEPNKIPVNAKSNKINIKVNQNNYDITCISMGNPHAVTFVDNLNFDIENDGKILENNSIFPERANIEFVKVINKNTFQMRVWERGSGETYACGTGACAVAVAAILNGFADFNENITIKLLGGDLKIKVLPDFRVFMEGEAEISYEGIYYYED